MGKILSKKRTFARQFSMGKENPKLRKTFANSKYGLSFALSEVVLKLWGKYGVEKKTFARQFSMGKKNPKLRKIIFSKVLVLYNV